MSQWKLHCYDSCQRTERAFIDFTKDSFVLEFKAMTYKWLPIVFFYLSHFTFFLLVCLLRMSDLLYEDWIKQLHYQSMHFFFVFVGREPTTWPTNNCLQIMVRSCAILSKCVFAVNDILRMLNYWSRSPVKMADNFPELSENDLLTMKTNLVIKL